MMKKFLLSLIALLGMTSYALANDATVADIQIRQGKSASAFLTLNVDETKYYQGFQFQLALPAGITCSEMTFQQTTTVDGETVIVDVVGPEAHAGADIPATAAFVVTSSYVNQEEPQEIKFVCYSGAGNPINTSTGNFVVLEIPLYATGAEAGSNLTATISELHFADAANKDIEFPGLTFNIEIVEDLLVLNEESEELPEEFTGKVEVTRTIKANEWGTICLPFAMTQAQALAVFGDDAEFGYFADYDVDGGEGTVSETSVSNANTITINFDSEDFAEGFEANTPYLIKTTKNIDKFTVDGVTVEPDEENAYLEYNNGKTGTKKRVYGTFFGTLRAGNNVPANSLFLSGGKFYYSTGITKIMGFRGYFTLNNILADMASNGVKMDFDVTTKIDGVAITNSEGAVYTVDGKFVGRNVDLKKLQKGIYVIDGKKVAIK